MSQIYNPKLVTNGLVFIYDDKNIKSYTGPQITNIATQLSTRGDGVNTYYKFYAGTDTDFIPTLGNITYPYMDMYNDYNGGSGNCCPSPFTYGNGISVSGSTLYTYGVVYRSANRYTHPNLMYHYEYNGGTYLTEFGVHNSGYSWQETHLGNGWYWSRAKFTSQPTATLIYTGAWMYQYATWNRWEIAKVLIAPGDWTNLHPKYWPNVGTTRSNTQVIKDLTGNNTVTASSLTYNNDGSFSFDGSSNYLTLGNDTNLIQGNQITVEAWVKTNVLGVYKKIFTNGNATGVYLSIGPSPYNTYFGVVTNGTSGGATWTTDISTSAYTHMVGTYNGSICRLYVNGEEKATGAASGTMGTGSTLYVSGYASGSERWNGLIPVIKVYNRALSASEVTQNFNALRGRFGV